MHRTDLKGVKIGSSAQRRAHCVSLAALLGTSLFYGKYLKKGRINQRETAAKELNLKSELISGSTAI